MLMEGLKLSGESKDFFMRGRVRDLKNNLPENYSLRKILDYGCGLGETAEYLAETFPGSHVTGADTSASALSHARERCENPSVAFTQIESMGGPYDLCYTNGVFHHIAPEKRLEAVKQIYRALAPGGFFALFENNPKNPGTRMVMNRIAFDRDAKPLCSKETETLLREGGFEPLLTRFLFYFPKPLAFLRFLEPLGVGIPYGAQYYVLASKR